MSSSDRPEQIGYVAPGDRPSGADERFMLNPDDVRRQEALLERDIQILIRSIITKEITDQDLAKKRGQDLLDRYYMENMGIFNREASEEDLETVSPRDRALQLKLATRKRDWDRIVEDLFGL